MLEVTITSVNAYRVMRGKTVKEMSVPALKSHAAMMPNVKIQKIPRIIHVSANQFMEAKIVRKTCTLVLLTIVAKTKPFASAKVLILSVIA